jgi:HSP20 family molecular chaperone IbpA
MKRDAKSAAKLVVLENGDAISAETEAIQLRIRQRAFEISRTRPPDAHEIYDWIMAESEIISVPAAELIETDSGFEMKFAVGAVDPSDVNVLVTPTEILIKAEYRHEHDSDNGTVHLCDFRSATVFRSLTLPQPINVNTVSVESADGMLLVSALKEGAAAKSPKRASRRPPPKKSRARLP